MSGRPTRREVLRGGGAILLSFTLPLSTRRVAEAQQRSTVASFFELGSDGHLTVLTGKVEIGQGIKTALSQIVAEELDLPLARIDLVTADTERTPNEGYTAGSMSIERSGEALRAAAAELKQILLELAARELDTDTDSLVIETNSNGAALVRSRSTGRAVTLGELARKSPTERTATGAVVPESPERLSVVGESVPRIDLPAKVFGQPAFVHDLRLPDMLHARIVRPPTRESRLEALDPAPVEAIPGVVSVHRDGSFLAVIARREEQAIDGAQRASELAKWSTEEGPRFDRSTSVSAWLRGFEAQSAVIHTTPASGTKAHVQHRASYEKPFLAHGSIGPSCAVALLDEGKLTVWSQTQGPYPLRSAIHSVLGSTLGGEDNIRVVHMEGAGCYGHNGADDAGFEAALLALALPGKPIRVQWSRHDEHGWEPFGSAMLIELRSSLDEQGRVTEWQHELWSHPHSTRPGRSPSFVTAGHLAAPVESPRPFKIPLPSGGGARNALPLYDFPGQKITENFIADMPVRVSALRSLGAFANIFAIESFVDELARLAGADPIAFRLRHLKDARARAVLEKLAELAPSSDRPEGVGLGYAFAQYKNRSTYCAIAVQALVDRATGTISLPRVTSVADAGRIVNPDGARNQIEGGIVQAASWTLSEQVTIDPSSGVTSRDWSSYPILRFEEAPRITVELIDRPTERSLGIGEAAQGPTAAAIGNAVFDASGVRSRALPMTPERVLRELRTTVG